MRNGKSPKNKSLAARGEAGQSGSSSPAQPKGGKGVNVPQFVNLTPHEINVYSEDGNTKIISIPPSGTIARVSVSSTTVKYINNIPVKKVVYGEVQGLPESKPNTVYIVSSLVLQALKGTRDDVVAPDTSPSSVIRDEQGRIVGVKGFIVV